MPIILRTSREPAEEYVAWISINNVPTWLDHSKKFTDIGHRLEEVFNTIGEELWEIGRRLGMPLSGRFAHTPTAAVYNCDLGLMMAWSKLIEELSTSRKKILVICDDPWMFRHLASISGVETGNPPPLWPSWFRYQARGYMARMFFCLRIIWYMLATRHQRSNHRKAAHVLMVYGHPDSNDNGWDAYFGNLMREYSSLVRLVHTDGSINVAQAMSVDGKTASLHAWGNWIVALSLIFSRWRAALSELTGYYGWLVRRAVVKENSTAAIATNHWQTYCQDRWIAEICPTVVCWPWENHPWERNFVRSARQKGIHTCGYQHTVIGPHQFNYALATNPDGLTSIPDKVICNGPAYRRQLLKWGIPKDRLEIGGAFRIVHSKTGQYDPSAPIFVALSAIPEISKQMMAAVNRADKNGRIFYVKDHPLYTFDINETSTIRKTEESIPGHDNISAVFFGTGTSGLEGVLAGIPTFKFQPDDCVSINILPDNITVKSVSSDNFDDALNNPPPVPDISWESVFSDPDLLVWKHQLKLGKKEP